MDRSELLAGLISKAKQAYYFSGEAIMSDSEYDALEDELRSISPDHPVLHSVGAPVPADNHLQRVKHRMAMGSQSKVNTPEEFSDWIRLRGVGEEELHLSLKADGCSIAAYYEKGRLVQVVSRGDGVEGEDVTANAVSFRGVPMVLPGGEDCAVRLEAVLMVSDWMEIDPDGESNPRSLANGILGRKDGRGAGRVTALAFDVEGVGAATEKEKCAWLEDAGFRTTKWTLAKTQEEVGRFWESENRSREDGQIDHWSDGVVVKVNAIAKQAELGEASGRPKGQVAWKFRAEAARSTIEAVEWTVGHTGAVTPVAVISPVRLGGTTVRRASLSNPAQIEALGLLDRSVVEVSKAGDIIPKITRVVEAAGAPIAIPTACPECGGGVAGVSNSDGSVSSVIYCSSQDCEAKASGRIRRWAKSRDILGLGDAVIEAMCAARVVGGVPDLLRLKPEDIQGLVINSEKGIRLGAKRASSICSEIASKGKAMTLAEFLGGFGTRSLGVRRAQLMMEANPDLLDVNRWLDGSLLDPDFSRRAGVPGSGHIIFAGIKEREASIREALGEIVITATVPKKAAIGPEICITGSLPSGKKKGDWEKPLQDAGFTLVDSVGKNLHALVVADPEAETAKSRKAAKLGIRIITEGDLERLVKDRAGSAGHPLSKGTSTAISGKAHGKVTLAHAGVDKAGRAGD